jgi:cytochrome P450
MTELMRNQKAMRKAQDEVRNLTGSKREVEETDLQQLQYLKCVIKETMRLHAPVPLLLPRVTTNHVKISGYDIPANTRIIVNAWAIGRDPGIWKNPEAFLPERFLNSSLDIKGHDFELIPFGAGRRVCPAMNFGIVTVEIALANLLHSFDWKLPVGFSENEIDTSEAPGLVVDKKHDLYLVGTKYAP